jgi:hypothetical protein
MSRGDDPFQAVLAALARDPATEFGVPGAQVETLRTIEGRFSCVRRVRIRTAGRTTHAYIKIMKLLGGSAGERARLDRMLEREYKATGALYAALRHEDGLSALQPMAYLPDHRAIVTEEVPGRPFDEVLGRAAGITDALRLAARRVGRWVQVYQAIGGEAGVVELPERRAYLDERLKRLQGRVLSAGERDDALRLFDRLASAIGATVPAVAIHADLAPANIVVGDHGRVTVLDFAMAKSGTRHHDLGHVYVHLALMAYRRPRRAPMFRELQAEMLDGYEPGLAPSDPLFALMVLQHAACHVAMLAERRFPVGDVAWRWYMRRRWDACWNLVGAPPEGRLSPLAAR